MIKGWRERVLEWTDLKDKVKSENSKAKHYAMLYQNALEENIDLHARCAELKRRIQELEFRAGHDN